MVAPPPCRPGGNEAWPEPLVELGRIVKRHGIRGELKLQLHNPVSRTLETVREVYLERSDGLRLPPAQIDAVRPHQSGFLVRFAGVDNANAADVLVGAKVLVPRNVLPDLEPGEVYHFDLLGCRVHTEDGEDLGTVREVLATGSNDVCAVRDGERESLIPLIDDVVLRVDLETGVMIVRRLPGLLEPGR
jgi:16S rRNA processing protein RimM